MHVTLGGLTITFMIIHPLLFYIVCKYKNKNKLIANIPLAAERKEPRTKRSPRMCVLYYIECALSMGLGTYRFDSMQVPTHAEGPHMTSRIQAEALSGCVWEAFWDAGWLHAASPGIRKPPDVIGRCLRSRPGGHWWAFHWFNYLWKSKRRGPWMDPLWILKAPCYIRCYLYFQ